MSSKILSSCFAFITLFTTQAALASNTVSVRLDKTTIQSGYTVRNDTGTFTVGIPGRSLSANSAVINLKKIVHPDKYSLNNETLLGDLYSYSVFPKSTNLKQNLWLQLSYPADQLHKKKVIKYWHAPTKTWRRIKHTHNHKRLLMVGASLKRKQAVIGVFTTHNKKPSTNGAVVSGLASWYNADSGAACNDFPMGSRIRVTNVATGATVDTTIVSTGPFVAGRVVDLNQTDFAVIADLGAGVIPVTVEQL